MVGVSVKTIHREIHRGNLPAYKIGGQWRVDEDELRAYIRERRFKLRTASVIILILCVFSGCWEGPAWLSHADNCASSSQLSRPVRCCPVLVNPNQQESEL